jgi:short-subunit dehydrogenase
MSNAIVTGASSGIGEATVRRLAREGFATLAVARREDRLQGLARELEGVTPLAVDVTDPDAPSRLATAVEEHFDGRLHLLVNNAGASWRAEFGSDDGGFENVRRTMEINFHAPVRLTEALLPALRRSAPSAIVNVSSVAGRVAYPRASAYAASKFALAGWSEALRLEEAENGVHVGVVFPGFVATEGFPQKGLVSRASTRWAVSKPERVAEAILAAGPGGKAERTVPRPYALVPVLAAVAPAAWRRIAGLVKP